MFHRQGASLFAEMIPEAAECFLKKMPVVFSVGIVQNAYDEICEIEIAEKDGLMAADRRLLEKAREKMARFKFDEADVLIIDEIGKEISGFGHDPNVTGRPNGYKPDFGNILRIKRMFIRKYLRNVPPQRQRHFRGGHNHPALPERHRLGHHLDKYHHIRRNTRRENTDVRE